ncbi:Phosphatidylinositol 4-kinase LSB6 [Rhodosporidiobolus nylandii]
MPAPPSTSAYMPLETPATEPPPSAGTNTAEHVDLLFKKWTQAVAQRMRLSDAGNRRKRRAAGEENGELEAEPVLDRDEVVETWESVFGPYIEGEEEDVEEDVEELEEDEIAKDGRTKKTASAKGKGTAIERSRGLHHSPPMDQDRFLALVDDIRHAISAGEHPKLNEKGSSGSYFARNERGETLAIFKPADEEPYGQMNPKLLKWIHRTLLAPLGIPFGRSCLPPGQSFISEAAASVLDRALGTDIVPRTEVVKLASPAFFYSWADRERQRRGQGLKEKEGSLQVFLKGFKVRPSSSRKSTQPPKRKHHRRSAFASLFCLCGRAGAEALLDAEEAVEGQLNGADEEEDEFEWTEEMVESFREGLECLVILDFLIRNTDRGLDNFMVKSCSSCSPPAAYSAPAPLSSSPSSPNASPSASSSSPPSAPNKGRPHLHLAAIDNSLAFPHKHPRGWRSYPYGWLYLPLSLIGRPWSAATRARFLPKLRDPRWWAELKRELRAEFKRDMGRRAEAWERQWEKQWALVKGQGWNLAESLKRADEGPLELCRRPKKLIFDDYVLVPASSSPPKSAHLPPTAAAGASPSSSQATNFLPSSTSTPSATRPNLQEQRCEPLPPSPPPVPPQPLSRTANQHLPPPKNGKHRRSASDYSTFSSSLSSSAALAQRTTAKTTRPSFVGVSVSPLSAGNAEASSAAAELRKPLDSLSASLGKHMTAFSHPSPDEANVEEGDEEEEEETGVGLMRRLDRVEEIERKRLRKARKDKAVRAALEQPLSSEGEDEARVGSPAEGRDVGALSRSVPAPSSPFAARAAGEGRRKWSNLFRRSASDDNGTVSGERQRLLAQDVVSPGDAAEEEEREGLGRLSMSWYGGQRLDGVEEREEDVAEQGPSPPGTTGEGTRGRKWVVVERMEDVKEPKRLWWPLRYRA